jgi:hypothetical protein
MSLTDVLITSKTAVVCLYLLIAVIGLISNLLSFIIFSQKKFQNTVFSIYFRFIVIFDILSMMIPVNKFFEFNLNIWFRDFSDPLCKFRYYYIYVVFPISGWGLVAVSIDRYFSIVYPTKFSIRKNILFQILVCCGILVYNLVYYIPQLFYYINISKSFNNKTNQTIITKKCVNQNYPTDWLNILNTTLIPFALMFVFTLITLRKLFKSRKNSCQNSQSSSNKTRQKDIRFAITSITLNVIFLLLNLPYGVYSILVLNISMNKDLEKLIYSIIYVPFYLNLTSLFFINLKVNSIFRNEFIRIFFSKKTNKNILNPNTKNHNQTKL